MIAERVLWRSCTRYNGFSPTLEDEDDDEDEDDCLGRNSDIR